MSRLQRAHSPQGEFSRADHNPLAAQGTLTGTKLSQHTACMAATGTKLSPHTAYMATTGTKLSGQSPPQGQPVQNSPSTAKNAHFSPSSASRENFFPVQTQTTRAGRIFSRRPPLTSHAAHTHGTKFSPQPPPQGRNRYKTLRAIPASRPTGTKLSPHSPTRTRTLKVACNSITARIRAYSKALESQGSVITARRTHWGIACETAEHPERRHTKRGRWSFTGPASYLSVLSAQTRATIRRARSARSPSSGRCGAGDARRR